MDTTAGRITGPRIGVIMTCFNRRQKTLACFDAVLAQTALRSMALDFFITDDGSTDGTADALLGKHPRIRLFKGNGALYWNGGMHLAWSEALRGAYDFFLWLNDDTFLYPDTLQRLVDTHYAQSTSGDSSGSTGNTDNSDNSSRSSGRAGIVIGSTQDGCGNLSYGGERQRSWLRPLTLSNIAPQDVAQRCDTFNGNCVLIPRAAAAVLGNLDAGFVHAMGDTDYGLRARRAGIPMWLLPGFAGSCVNDSNAGGIAAAASLPLKVRMHQLLGPKGLPLRPWRLLCQRHAGYLWPIYWSWPYLKVVATTLYLRTRRRIG
jgi:GT2 family glycosyltransferase